MRISYALLTFIASVLFIFSKGALAFDKNDVLPYIQLAKAPVTLGIAAAPLPPEDANKLQNARLESEEKARFQLLSTCEGRFGGLQNTLKKQVNRSELISSAGGLIGVIGAVATCPHCAALAAGIAGLANPLQQTFKDNSDTPQDTQDRLNKLSIKINDELDSYSKLPAAIVGDSNFDKNLQSRLDILFITAASCQFYTTSLQAAK